MATPRRRAFIAWCSLVAVSVAGYIYAVVARPDYGTALAALTGLAFAFLLAVLLNGRHVQVPQPNHPTRTVWPSSYGPLGCPRITDATPDGKRVTRCGHQLPCPDHRARYNLVRPEHDQ